MAAVVLLNALSMSDRFVLGLPTRSRRIATEHAPRLVAFTQLGRDMFHEGFDASFDDDDALQELALEHHLSTILDTSPHNDCDCGACAECLIEEAQEFYHPAAAVVCM